MSTPFQFYDVNAYPTVSSQSVVDQGGLPALPAAQDPPGTVYAENQVTFNKTLVLNTTFDLLTKMIDMLQNAAVAQANRITFLTQWQDAYTSATNQIHSFAANNGDAYDDANADANMMTNLNQTNSIYSTEEGNRRQVVATDAQSLQTSVNQTADAVNSQSNLATSFLQTMSTLLSTVFKSG